MRNWKENVEKVWGRGKLTHEATSLFQESQNRDANVDPSAAVVDDENRPIFLLPMRCVN